MNLQTCRNCQQKFKLKKRRGEPSAFCSVACRDMFKKEYHKQYDATPDQLARRRDYMTKYRGDGRQKDLAPDSQLMRNRPKTKAKKKARRETREAKTRDLIEGHEQSLRTSEEHLWEPPEGDQS